jgi:gamma-glutamyltranspeptidase/glutathione hydrolase
MGSTVRWAAAWAGALAWLVVALAAVPAAAQLALREKVTTTQEMVVTANPVASEAGAQVLRRGGNAIDAAIAVQAVLGLTEPQSSGIGGGGFLLYYDAERKELTSFDARETAPAAADGRLFFDAAGQVLDFSTAVFSGRSVGVPGMVALWDLVSSRYGSLPLNEVLRPAVRLAREGFPISPRLAASIDSFKTSLAQDEGARAYFLNPDGSGKAAGTVLRNPEYARVLARVGLAGARAFYSGRLAENIVEAVTTDPRPGGPGSMTLADLAGYRVIERAPVCGGYRDTVVCSMGPPSSGGLAELQILGILNSVDLPALGLDNVQTIHAFLQANRLAFADRNLYVADPDYIAVPTAGLIDPGYLAGRAALLTTGPLPPGLATPGTPPAVGAGSTADASQPRFGGTSHISIVDRFGNVVSTTVTVEAGFGNNRLVDGFVLNNELTDFSFDPGPDGRAGRQPSGGRQAPAQLDDAHDRVHPRRPARLRRGSPGGASIIGTTTQAVVAMVDFGLDPQQAANQAHFQNNNTAQTTLESLFSGTIPSGQPGGAPAGTTGLIGPFDVRSLIPELTALGYSVSAAPTVLTSGLNLIKIVPGGLEGGTDPRREGLVTGR